jgi:cell fate (sporulation/competence/biofilm development) regulator YlbF (YheA/YmcA/DUF963 family)
MNGFCPTPNSFITRPPDDPQVRQSIETLSTLLQNTPEYQHYKTYLSALEHSNEALRLAGQIRRSKMFYPAFAHPEEQAELEKAYQSLPEVQALQQAETALAALLAEIDREISAELGVSFAGLAAQAANGCAL